MDIQSAALNELFKLYPVLIPGWITPVRPAGIAEGGIPKSLYDGVPTGLQCLVDPWIERSWTLAAGDRVDLYVNNGATPVAGKTINPGEESQRIRLNVPHRELLDGVNTLHYVVTRPGGNFENSRELKVLYHLRAPGEPAPDKMKLQIPTIVRDHGVDAEQAEKGVVFSFDYTFRRAYDRIRLTLGTIPVIREVAPGEEGPGQPLTTQTLFTETFKQSGDNEKTLIFYSVVDQLGNRNSSADEQIKVHLNRLPSLQPPSVKEASGNNLNPLAAKERLTAVLPADLPSTDLVSVTWAGPAGAPADGTYTTLPRPISETGHEIQLPTSVIPFCLGKQTKLTYIATRGGTSIPSPSFPVNVQSLPLSELRMPMLKEASNNGEGPDLLLHELTAQGLMWFPGFPFIAVDQPVWFRLKGTRSNGDVYDKLLWQPPGAYINQDWFDKGFFEHAAPYADLMDLKDGTPLTMELKVGFGRSTNEAEAVSFQVRSYTVKAVAATVLKFTNEPYLIAPAGQVKNLELSLRTPENQPVSGANITVELPANVTYADGGSGARDFTTEVAGTVTVRGVKGHTTPGTYNLSAVSGGERANADLIIAPQGPGGQLPIKSPTDVVYSRDGRRIYMCGGGYLTVIDALSLQILRTVQIDGVAIAVSPDDSRLYLVGAHLAVVDTTDWSIIASIPNAGGIDIVLSSDGARAYVTRSEQITLTIIDTKLMETVASVSIPSDNDLVHGMAISPDNTRVYIPLPPNSSLPTATSTLCVIDTQKLEIIHRFQLNIAMPTRIVISPDGQRAYICSSWGRTVLVINPNTGALIKSFPVDAGFNGMNGLAISADGTRVYVSTHIANSVFGTRIEVIDTARLEMTRLSYSIPNSNHNIALSPDETRLAICVGGIGLAVIANR